MKLGLKIWSVNTGSYLHEARRLYAEGVYDYLELYIVPGSQETLSTWQGLHRDLSLPFVLHAPHSRHGVNLADADKRVSNAKAFDEVRRFADGLGAEKIIVHGGWYAEAGDSAAAHAQLAAQLTSFADARLLLENKPYLPIGGLPRRLVGSTPDEIRSVLAEAGCGFCLDIGHMVVSANAHRADWRSWFGDFLSLRPAMFHLSDLKDDSIVDQHLHFGDGALPLGMILARLSSEARISIETQRNSKTNLNDFVEDVRMLKKVGVS